MSTIKKGENKMKKLMIIFCILFFASGCYQDTKLSEYGSQIHNAQQEQACYDQCDIDYIAGPDREYCYEDCEIEFDWYRMGR